MQKMKPFIELIDEVISNNKHPQDSKAIIDFISDEKACVEFMNAQLKDDFFDAVDKYSDVYELAQNRARHSVVTYLLGLVFMRFGGILDNLKDRLSIWIKLSMYHDYGYFSKHVENPETELRSVAKKYYLLEDAKTKGLDDLNNYSTIHTEDFAYTYDEIEDYFKYSKRFHAQSQKSESKKGKEMVDHGVLGGVLVFEHLANKIIKQANPSEMLVAKKFCLTIAQHNMFRIGQKYRALADDLQLEKLYEENAFRINKAYPLLLFLSLIDTVECVKKFSKGENANKSFRAKTVLSKLLVSVDEERIELDFSELRKHAKNEGKEVWFNEVFDNYKESVSGFDRWTCLQGKCIGDSITITIK